MTVVQYGINDGVELFVDDGLVTYFDGDADEITMFLVIV